MKLLRDMTMEELKANADHHEKLEIKHGDKRMAIEREMSNRRIEIENAVRDEIALHFARNTDAAHELLNLKMRIKGDCV